MMPSLPAGHPPEFPEGGSYRLLRARLHGAVSEVDSLPCDGDGFALADIDVSGGHIARIAAAGSCDAAELPEQTVDLGGRVVLPCFVDCHTHIDKGHIWPRRANPDGSFAGARSAVAIDREMNWSAADVGRRMDFALRCAYAHGTAALRTHIDSGPPQDAISWPVFQEMREAWRGRIELQAASLIAIDQARDDGWLVDLARRMAAVGGVLGAVSYMVEDLPQLLDRMFGLAGEYGLDLDFHADETGDPGSRALGLIAETALRHRFQGKILVGHCCALARYPESGMKQTLDRVARAGVAVVSLPMCNLYLQDRRPGTTPHWRGVTRLHELKAHGVTTLLASDNTRDPFYAYGDLDMLEVYREATRILHLDHPIGDWVRSVTRDAAAIMRVGGAGRLSVGGPADLVVLRGRNWSEVLSRPESRRTVIRDGRPIDTTPPDYVELDDLEGMPPST